VLTPPAGGAPSPDIPNWCWHEYGNRVGFWRMLKVFDEFAIPGVLAINGCAIDAYPPIVKAANERNWEFIGHGFTQRSMQKVPDEKADIHMTTEAIRKATGKPPRGWLGPGLTETWETPDLLKEDGYDYVADWVLDDQPVWLKTRTKPIVNVPYTQECNDVAMMLIQHHKASEYYDRAMDQFEQIYADAEGSARVMALVVHPYIMGEVFPQDLRKHPTQARRAVLDRLADPRLVSVGRAEGAIVGVSFRCGRSPGSLPPRRGACCSPARACAPKPERRPTRCPSPTRAGSRRGCWPRLEPCLARPA
jgi:hypothetical protein